MDVSVHNPGPNVLFVGGVMIPAGETVQVPGHLAPPALQPPPVAAEEAPPVDALADLQRGTVADIRAALDGLDDAALARLGDLEQTANKPRSSLLAAIAEEVLRRADARHGEGAGG